MLSPAAISGGAAAGMSEDGPSRLEGRLVARGERTAILRYPLSTALPIPLAVAAPSGIRLVTFAFAGLDAADRRGPRGLLVLALGEGNGLGAGLRLATHFCDIDIALGAAADAAEPEERALAARALLAAASPDETAALADLIGPLGEAIAALPPDAEAPVLAQDEGDWRLTGTAVPGHLLLRAGEAWSCHRVARAHLHLGGSPRDAGTSRPPPPPEARGAAGPRRSPPDAAPGPGWLLRSRLAGSRIPSGTGSRDEGAGGKATVLEHPQAVLVLAPVWGEAPAGRLDGAIGLTTDGFTPYRIAR